MKWLITIVEDHLWYPITLLYIGVVAFAFGLLIGYLL